MKKVIILNKKEGETPLKAMDNFRIRNREYRNVKMTYAGRLDPMAKGLMIVLSGEEVKNKQKYLELDKEYEFEVLFGFATDTYDILGKVVSVYKYSSIHKIYAHLTLPGVPGGSYVTQKSYKSTNLGIQENLKYFKGKFKQDYPIYSSKTVNGKQLFTYARSGVDVKIPNRMVSVRELKFIKLKTISGEKLLENIEKRINKVKGDFRQKETLNIWRKKLGDKNNTRFYIGNFKIKCSSGTYVRGIAHSLGDKMGMPALTFSIKRTKIGKYRL